MFDEKSPKWINIFKTYTQVMFWICMVLAVILCFLGWGDCIIITESAFLDGLILLISCAFAGFAQLVVNMLIIQLLNNVQIIRENLEKKND